MKFTHKVLILSSIVFVFCIFTQIFFYISSSHEGEKESQFLIDGFLSLEKKNIAFEVSSDLLYYDEVLTQSARNYAFTQDLYWKERYVDSAQKLDYLFANLKQSDAQLPFADVDDANSNLITLEEQAIAYVDESKVQEAIAILESEEYSEHKKKYQEGLQLIIQTIGVNLEEKRTSFSQGFREMLIEHQGSDKTKLLYGLLFELILYVLLIGIVLWLTYSLLFALNRIIKVIDEISLGKLDSEIIDKDRDDEIGELARAFDRTLVSLKLSMRNKNMDQEQLLDHSVKGGKHGTQ